MPEIPKEFLDRTSRSMNKFAEDHDIDLEDVEAFVTEFIIIYHEFLGWFASSLKKEKNDN